MNLTFNELVGLVFVFAGGVLILLMLLIDAYVMRD